MSDAAPRRPETAWRIRARGRFASDGGVTALFGPSGAGKTTLVNMIAGLLGPDRGTIGLDGEVLDDTAARIDVPPHRRRIGYVFQDGRLFPHLDVRQNLDYGRRMNGLAADPAQLTRVAELLDIGAPARPPPGKLSGGERQRVAIGRALLSKPRLLLLDEPLASLDEARKAEILPYLIRLRDEGSADGLCQPRRRRVAPARDANRDAERGPRDVVRRREGVVLGRSVRSLNSSLRGAKRRSDPDRFRGDSLDCTGFARNDEIRQSLARANPRSCSAS